MSGLPAEKAIKSRPGLDPEESSPSPQGRNCPGERTLGIARFESWAGSNSNRRQCTAVMFR
jgi:hypothetical protein